MRQSIEKAERYVLVRWLAEMYLLKLKINELRKDFTTTRKDMAALIKRRTGYSRLQLSELLRDTEWKVDIAKHAINRKLILTSHEYGEIKW